MATATKDQKTQDAQAVFAPAVDLSEKLATIHKELAAAYIDGYEKSSLTFADYQEEAAKAAESEWAVKTGTAQAEFTRKLTVLNAQAAREALNQTS
jgi:hypothetical protein